MEFDQVVDFATDRPAAPGAQKNYGGSERTSIALQDGLEPTTP